MGAARNSAVPPGTAMAAALGAAAACWHAALGGSPAWAPAWVLGFVALHAGQLGALARWGRLDARRGRRWAWTLLGCLPLALLVHAAAGGPRPHALHVAAAVVLATVCARAWPLVRLAATANAGHAAAAARIAAAPLAVAALVALAHRPSGDEPHYLWIAQSLVEDGDVELSNQLAAAHPGRGPTEWPFHGVRRRVGDRWEFRSQHLPGLPALLAPGVAVAGRAGALVILWLCALGAAAAACAWARALGVPPPAALAAALLVVVAAPGGPYASRCFPEMPAALLLTAAAFAARPGAPRGSLLAAALLAALPWLNARYAPAGLAVGAFALWRARRSPAALAALVVLPAVAAVAWFWWHHAQHGSWDPRAGYGVVGGWLARASLPGAADAVWGSLLDHRVGLLPVAPVWGVALVLGWRRGLRPAALVVWGPLAATLALGATAIMSWDGSWSPAARWLVSCLPCAAPWLAAGLHTAWGGGARPVALALAAFTGVQGFVALANPSLGWADGTAGRVVLCWRAVEPLAPWLAPAAVLGALAALAWLGTRAPR